MSLITSCCPQFAFLSRKQGVYNEAVFRDEPSTPQPAEDAAVEEFGAYIRYLKQRISEEEAEEIPQPGDSAGDQNRLANIEMLARQRAIENQQWKLNRQRAIEMLAGQGDPGLEAALGADDESSDRPTPPESPDSVTDNEDTGPDPEPDFEASQGPEHQAPAPAPGPRQPKPDDDDADTEDGDGRDHSRDAEARLRDSKAVRDVGNLDVADDSDADEAHAKEQEQEQGNAKPRHEQFYLQYNRMFTRELGLPLEDIQMLETHLKNFAGANPADRDSVREAALTDFAKSANPTLLAHHFAREITHSRRLAETPTPIGATFDLVFYPVLLLGAFALFFLLRRCLKRRERERSLEIPRWSKAGSKHSGAESERQ